LASPIKAFLRDRCEVGPGKSVPCEDLFKAWQEWCRSQNRDAVGTLASFGRDLRAAVPGLTTPQRRVDGRRRRRFEGVGLIPYDNNLVALVAG
jgi:putative DNA primase/helicase